jgi:hypothetical protein
VACSTTTPRSCSRPRRAMRTPACCYGRRRRWKRLVHAGDRGQARAAFNSAVDIYTPLGAAADVARLQAAFRAHGIRRGPHAEHRRAQSGWAGLTPTEIKIAVLAEEGLSCVPSRRGERAAARALLHRPAATVAKTGVFAARLSGPVLSGGSLSRGTEGHLCEARDAERPGQ